MKNASLIFLCCILCTIITPITMCLYYVGNKDATDESDITITVLQHTSCEIVKMPIEEYVWRVTAKEMSYTFADDAIKAQSVAARTYAMRKISSNLPEHKGADVCTDFNHCSAFLLPDENLGDKNKDICKKIRDLTLATKNQILIYDSEPILAVFHAISSGTTEKSSDVWVSQLPYLINVDSPLDKKADGYNSSVTFPVAELKSILGYNNNEDIEIISRTTGGSVNEISVFGKKYKGIDIRKILKLRSANFSVTRTSDVVTFDVLGYGHGVGMSQAGANEYAKAGMNYHEILEKYYPGTTISYIE